ncbi:MAG: CPBP family intramembrane metalloprotease, partial [Anaerolineae bacterium]|nr:CPBP family intramembrane metalloprotease [Anaerolineae bacterium]
PGEVGLGKGHRILPVTLLWCIIPLLALIFFVTSGQTTFERVANVFVSNFMQNGFFEEFLFRGALQSRLRRLVSPFWAVVISALIFGVWHLGLGFSSTGGNFLTALASTLAYQAFLGLAFGVIFERTRNLVAGSAVHVVLNTFGQVINA